MTTNGESKFSYLLIGLGLGAVGGLMAAILARKETRELLRERSGKSLDYLNQQAGKLRETADVIVQQGYLTRGLTRLIALRKQKNRFIRKTGEKIWEARDINSFLEE